MPNWDAISRDITAATDERFTPTRHAAVGGGCINAAWVLSNQDQSYFVKLNRAAALPTFEAERVGLEEIAASASVRVPRPIAVGADSESSWLVLEHLAIGPGGGACYAVLGEKLAAMHRHTRECFGWKRDNTIGSTPQVNTATEHWVDFWRRHRLGYQLSLAARNGHRGRLQRDGEGLLNGLGAFFEHYRPAASLLHGDLWGGNAGALATGEPVVFDPAVYYGDREADIAMTELFGGFGPDFRAAYEALWPLDSGFRIRRDLYNLYHVLNHLNLFGSGYLHQAEGLLRRLLAELR